MTKGNGYVSKPFSLSYSGDVKRSRGYRLTSIKTTRHSVVGQLELVGEPAHAFGQDIANLTLEVEYRREDELRVHISDTRGTQYQVPSDFRYDKQPEDAPRSTSLYFHHQDEPFAFWITRTSGEVIFDTRPDNIPVYEEPLIVNDFPVRDTVLPAYPLVFSDQYLQIASALPSETNIYGLGDVVATSGFRRDNHGTVQSFWNGDPAGNSLDRNLYGTHPFYLESRQSAPGLPSLSHGVFLRNSHGTDVILRTGVVEYRTLGGTLDFTFLAGPEPHRVVQQYSNVVGRPAQMPYWSFGFHLCSIGHSTLLETQEVVDRMADSNIPLECIWNDFYYMDRKRNFTLSKDFPPEPFKQFTRRLHDRGQRYIPLLDAGMYKPTAENDHYEQYAAGHSLDVFLKDEEGKEYEGYVWCGRTVWPDWTHQHVTDWWYQSIAEFKEAVDFDGLWLDMNEPANLPVASDKWLGAKAVISVDGRRWVDLGQNAWDYPPYAIHNGWKSLGDLTVAPSVVTSDGWRHYHQHNLYPIQEARVTAAALEKLNPGKRQFLLSRGTFAGQGTMTAHWLGDNDSKWTSMRETIQGVLQHQLFQMPMVGADVGGFAGTATEELVNRWMQLGAFLPFYRNHNAGPPQEPYLWPSVIEASRKAIDIRYRLLPYWESLFATATTEGIMPLRPLFFEFDDANLYNVDLQFMIGSALLVTACMHEGSTSVTGHFPTSNGTIWRDWYTYEVLTGIEEDLKDIPAPLGHIPIHIRGGSVILLHTSSGYTLKETRHQPLELLASLDSRESAEGEFLLDDGLSVKSLSTRLYCKAVAGRLTISPFGTYQIAQKLDQVVILGVRTKPTKCMARDAEVEYAYDSVTQGLKLSGLNASLDKDFELTFE
ncbi:glycoside hydrolase family 31 protein [Naematelia encephala]|uniref:Maltase n=1 Tax=Naematelia encephala TaxID=71784 RepID=A0A1Y2BJZ0_9TREE|nr:glycoside hydrolase family 31 protein [Naematelia encephala]